MEKKEELLTHSKGGTAPKVSLPNIDIHLI
jgi:hypothetical protein